MYKLIVFDLDGTLAALGKGVAQENLARLRALEEAGMRIAICSGKPTYYLCGFMRQAEIRAPILVGENGAVIQFGVDLPPRDYFVAPHSEAAKRSIRLLRDHLEREVPGMWYQPNEVGLTPFPRNEREFDAVQRVLDATASRLQDVIVYRHCDSFDITPEGITKKSGLERLGAMLGIGPQETIAVGDGVNDYPMFEYAGHAVGVNVRDAGRVHVNFSTADKALDHLLALVQSERN
ncbi:MAG: HAD family phosphatase [Clostridia bacterium]|nr:HAD family phosphatase [Clostridia bacterium]MBQ7051606.1 HAD family phosphatase [Clostridia bacterium]